MTTEQAVWQDQLAQLEREVGRVGALLNTNLDVQRPEIGGRFSLLLSNLNTQIKSAQQRAAADPGRRWTELATLQTKCREIFATQLELLGGLGLVDSVATQAEAWLDDYRRWLGLSKQLTVIAGRGPLLDLQMGVVRLPFLNLSLWRLPLLARALGLLAAAEDGNRGGKLILATDELLPTLADVLPASTVGALGNRLGVQRSYINHLFADMFATAIGGPAYALAVFVLELDYEDPVRGGLENPDQIEGRHVAPRLLPSTLERAAAILATLTAMNEDISRPAYKTGPYDEAIRRLTQIGQATLSAAAAQALATVQQTCAPWHQILYANVILEQVADRLPLVASIWQAAEERHRAWCNNQWGQAGGQQRDAAFQLTEILGALWLARLGSPQQADKLLATLEPLRKGQAVIVPCKNHDTLAEDVVVRARLDSLSERWQRLSGILQAEANTAADRAVVVGRFYRQLSRQVCRLEESDEATRQPSESGGIWQDLGEMEEKARPLERDALEYFGGKLIVAHGLDREPGEISEDAQAGPSVCALADRMMQEYAQSTGVNWNAQTLLGRDPLVESSTDVIRIRFPDWSIWNLPVLAHEFGHLVARASPDFYWYRMNLTSKLAQQDAEAARVVQAHLDEFFADIFAVYCLGPAFACDAAILQFTPVKAHMVRPSHPSHHERVGVILQTLAAMNEKTRRHATDSGIYADLHQKLTQDWETALTAAGAAAGSLAGSPAADGTRQVQTRAWAGEIFRIIDSSFRLGAGYRPVQWRWAQEMAAQILPTIPTLGSLRRQAQDFGMRQLSFNDLLNLLWWARVSSSHTTRNLTVAAQQIGHAYLKE